MAFRFTQSEKGQIDQFLRDLGRCRQELEAAVLDFNRKLEEISVQLREAVDQYNSVLELEDYRDLLTTIHKQERGEEAVPGR